MIRRKKKQGLSVKRIALWVLLLLLVIAAGLAWRYHAISSRLSSASAPSHSEESVPAAPSAPPATVESNHAQTQGQHILIGEAPRDRELGIAAPSALALSRSVEMYQWIEHCDASACRYETGWAPGRIDSKTFRVAAGHVNPKPPFADARFLAAKVRIGDTPSDPAKLAVQREFVDFPVNVALLPPNLAATFTAIDGALYAGGDAAKPRVGTLRIRYRIAPSVTQ